jgi:cell wall-associated NlpC family hydrolase
MSTLKLLHILKEEITEQGYGHYFRDWKTPDGKTIGDTRGFDFTTGKAVSSDFKNTPEDIEKMKKGMEKPETSSETEVAGELSSKESELVNISKSKVGAPYGWGSNGPNSFDCSGFVRWVIKQYQGDNANLPRVAHYMYKQIPSVSESELRPGDLVFIDTGDRGWGYVDHVGMVISPYGSDKIEMIHASGSKGVNIISDLKSSWYKNYIEGYGRPEIKF